MFLDDAKVLFVKPFGVNHSGQNYDKLYELPVSKRFVGLLSRLGLSEIDILDLCSYCLLQL